ncbi:hypothetical protein QJQ45_016223, partial [Haematococcus lacustris]
MFLLGGHYWDHCAACYIGGVSCAAFGKRSGVAAGTYWVSIGTTCEATDTPCLAASPCSPCPAKAHQVVRQQPVPSPVAPVPLTGPCTPDWPPGGSAMSDSGPSAQESGLLILAMAVFGPPSSHSSGPQPSLPGTTPQGLATLRSLACCLLACTPEGPLGPHSLLGSQLLPSLAASAPGEYEALSASGRSLMHRLADGVVLVVSPCPANRQLAMQLDVEELELVAKQAAPLPKGHSAPRAKSEGPPGQQQQQQQQPLALDAGTPSPRNPHASPAAASPGSPASPYPLTYSNGSVQHPNRNTCSPAPSSQPFQMYAQTLPRQQQQQLPLHVHSPHSPHTAPPPPFHVVQRRPGPLQPQPPGPAQLSGLPHQQHTPPRPFQQQQGQQQPRSQQQQQQQQPRPASASSVSQQPDEVNTALMAPSPSPSSSSPSSSAISPAQPPPHHRILATILSLPPIPAHLLRSIHTMFGQQGQQQQPGQHDVSLLRHALACKLASLPASEPGP